MHKNIFVNKQKQYNIVEDYKNLLIKIEKLKLSIIEFEEDNIIKPKIYFSNYIVMKRGSA